MLTRGQACAFGASPADARVSQGYSLPSSTGPSCAPVRAALLARRCPPFLPLTIRARPNSAKAPIDRHASGWPIPRVIRRWNTSPLSGTRTHAALVQLLHQASQVIEVTRPRRSNAVHHNGFRSSCERSRACLISWGRWCPCPGLSVNSFADLDFAQLPRILIVNC